LINKLNEGDHHYDPLDFRNSFAKLTNKSLSDMQTVETTQEIASFKPKLFSLSYKLAERKEKRDLQQLSEMFPDSKFAVEFNESYGQHQHSNNNYISSNRDLARSFSVDMSQLTVEELDQGLQQAELNLEAATDATIMSPQELKLHQNNNNNKSPTSKSLGSVSGLTASGTSMLSKHEKLFSNALLLQKKKEKLMEDVKKQEYAECTFHPVRQAKHYRPKKTHTNVSHNNVPLDPTEEIHGKEEDEEQQEESLQDTRITADGERGGGGRLNKAEEKMILDELNNNPFSPDTQRRLETMDIGDAFYESRREGEEEEQEDQKEAKEAEETNKDEPEMHEIDHSISKLSDISDPLVHSPPPPPPPSTDEQHQLHDLPAVILNSKNKSNTRKKNGQDTISTENNSLSLPLPPRQSLKSGKRRSENSHKPVSESKEGKMNDKKTENPLQQHQQQNQRDEELPVYDRLYAYKDHTPKALSEHQPSYLRELQQCTFQPNLSNTKNNLSLLKAKMNSKNPPPSSDQQIEGFSKTVDRMRKIISDKERKKIEESDETLRKIAEEKYVKSRKLAQRGQQPFHSHLDERIVKQQQEKQLHAPDTSKPE
jgi:hypothetical protein